MKNLILIGMMGCGKTTCGKLLAQRLEMQFLDMDAVISARCGCTISALFAQKGEGYFRDLESALARELSQQEGLVIATGGGVVLRQENMDALRGSGYVVFLNRPADAIFDGEDLSGRPLAQDGKAAFLRTFASREQKYRGNADLIVEEFSSPDATVDVICRALIAER